MNNSIATAFIWSSKSYYAYKLSLYYSKPDAFHVNINDIDNFKTQNYSNFLRQIIAKEDVWIEIKDKDENILISTILKKDESFNLPSNSEDIIISASNAGALLLKDRNIDHSDLGAFGIVLYSVNLNILITNH